MLLFYVKEEHAGHISEVEAETVGTGIMGRMVRLCGQAVSFQQCVCDSVPVLAALMSLNSQELAAIVLLKLPHPVYYPKYHRCLVCLHNCINQTPNSSLRGLPHCTVLQWLETNYNFTSNPLMFHN